MSKRINVILLDTIKVLDRVGEKNLKEQLKAGYQANSERNLEIAAEVVSP
ncbi:MAG: hypothetical protein ABSF22_20990 [Bryobacteraceae bacterium]